MSEVTTTSKDKDESNMASREGFEKLEVEESPSHAPGERPYLTGWRLHLATFGLYFGLYLVNLEVTVVSTSNLAIANDLNSYSKIGWILTGYLITYTGFIMVWAKTSDIVGIKTCAITSTILFIVFSAGCGAAQTVEQLIICRVFQGIGAAGGYALSLVGTHGMVPKEKHPLYGAMLSGTVAIANLSGPLVGGGLSKPNIWRWVFLLNVPAGAIAVIAVFIALPVGFPYHKNPSKIVEFKKPTGSDTTSVFRRLDILGAALLLTASLLLTTGLLEGGAEWSWKSGASISILTISGLLWIAFFVWERMVTTDKWSQEPIFPWRFLYNRAWMSVLTAAFLNGLPFYILVIALPQRFETVNMESPVQTGLKLLPYTFVAAVGGVIAVGIAGTGRIKPIWLMLFFSSLTTIGIGLLTTIPSTQHITKATYGYMTLAGLGIGGTHGLGILLVGYVVEERDIATSNGALIQFRILGGAIGLAIMAAVMENHLRTNLGSILTPTQLATVLKSTATIARLPEGLRAQVLEVFADGYTLQMKITTGLSGLQFFAIAFLWSRPQVAVKKMTDAPK